MAKEGIIKILTRIIKIKPEVNMFIVVLTTQFWMTVNDILNPREFKRLSGFFVSGGILGGILGGGLAGFLAESDVDYDLLLLASGILFLCVMVVVYIFRWEKRLPLPDRDGAEKSGEKPEVFSKPGFRDSLLYGCSSSYTGHSDQRKR